MSTSTATLRLALVARPTALVDAALVVGGMLLVAAAAQIVIQTPLSPVPITGQTFAVLLVGAGLGSLRGAAAMALYLLVGGIGAPVFADGAHGWTQVSGATGGYLVGFIATAIVVGFLAERGWDKRVSSSVSAMLTGQVVVFGLGCAWLSHELGTGLERTLELGLYPFVPGEILKLYLAAALLPGAWKLVGRLRG